AAFPDGGADLSAAVAAVVEADPSLATALITAAASVSPAQEQAIGAGLAVAASFFGRASTPAARPAATALQLAALNADPQPRASFFPVLAAGSATQTLPGTGSTGLTTNGCKVVSPSAPGQGC